ncbi:MAG: hypothetical protein RL417_1152, partial [Pseudomonadota bacterium]
MSPDERLSTERRPLGCTGTPGAIDVGIRLEEHSFPLPIVPNRATLSFGLSVASCENHRTLGGPIFLAHNFHDNSVFRRHDGNRGFGDSPMPLYIDPSPADSWAISQLGLNTAQRGEVALVPRPIPGALEYAIEERLNLPDQVIPLDIAPTTRGAAITDFDILTLA